MSTGSVATGSVATGQVPVGGPPSVGDGDTVTVTHVSVDLGDGSRYVRGDTVPADHHAAQLLMALGVVRPS